MYCPGSSPVTPSFFTELADLLDRLSTFVDPVVLAGDVNIRLERKSDPPSAMLDVSSAETAACLRHDNTSVLEVL